MVQFISPGVFTIERDISQYVSNLSATIVAMVGTADTGPSNTPTLITSASQYVSIFGQPNPNHYLGYAALSYLKQGSMLFVTRVAPADAAVAKLTVPIPKSSTPFIGNWALTSNTTTSAVFTITNATGATGAAQLVALPSTPDVTLSDFDFTDTTNVDPINGKLGSDLLSFTTSQALVDANVVGRAFKVVTGAGKGSSVITTNLVPNGDNPTSALDLTVDARKFNTFNSPLLTSATGSITSLEVAIFADTAPVDLVVIGKTKLNLAGEDDVTLIYDGTPGNGASTLAALLEPTTTLATLDNLVAVSTNKVTINVPLYSTTQVITAGDAALNATLIATILTKLIDVFRAGTDLSGTTNLVDAAPLCKATLAGITGIGSVDVLTGQTAGLKSATVQTDGVTIVTAAISLGASGNFVYTVTGAIVSAVNMGITGTFSLNMSRPTWIMNGAGSSFVPTLLKFSSNGQGDFSNLAITVDLDTSNVDSASEQQYVVSIFSRLTGLTVSTTSVSQSDFILVEKYTGTPSVLQSTINANSSLVQVKIDYSTEDVINYTTGAVVYGATPDYLTPSFTLFADASGKGVISGAKNVTSGTTLTPSFSAFLGGGSVGTSITKYDIIGDLAEKTGIYSVADPEAFDINLLIAPGWSADPDVATSMISLCVGRGDCMAILDTPFGLSVQDVIDYRNSVLNSGSNYAAIYYPWVKVVDSVNQKDIFVPPSGMVSAQYAYNDTVGDVFTAPAGRNRGNLLDAVAVERVLNQGDRDALTLAQINPIYSEAGYGIYIRGQMTLQSANTALNRVNVRRLFLNLRKVIATASKAFEFEPGDAITALRLKQLAESTLQDRLNKGAIRSYKVDVGASVNTAQVLENNQLRMSISVQPVKTAEIIIEVFNILPQGQGISIT